MNDRKITVLLIVFLAVMALCLPARADYHYASHEGSNEYPYTSWETAADSIQNAVDAAEAGDTAFIGYGYWYEYVDLYDSDTVAVIGMGIDSTFCNSDLIHNSIFYEVTNGCLIEGITLFNEMNGSCIYGRLNAGFSVRNCKFINSFRGINGAGYPTTEISNCIFDSCGRAILEYIWVGNYFIHNNLILSCYDDQAIQLFVESAIVENNIIINIRGPYLAAGIYGSPVDSAVIRNNIVVYGDYGIAVGRDVDYNNIVKNINWGPFATGITGYNYDSMFNNIIANCDEGISLAPGGGCTVSYNNFWNNQTDIDGPVGDSIGNIFCNPMLVSDDDFHLQAFSPCIDVGHPDYFDVNGSRSDIGAYGGPFGESYNYQDLPPAIPDSISGEFVQDTIFINWAYNTEADFSNYLLYKDTITGFEPSVFNLIAEPETSYYADTDVDNEHDYFYRIASVDNQDNISDYSEELEVQTTGIWDHPGATLPQITSIKTNYPNPFNISTTIVYWVANLGPIPAEIEINIYDIVGRKVRTVIKERRDIGEHTIIWDGKDHNGNECSTGVYFARISQWGLEVSGKPRKLVLVK